MLKDGDLTGEQVFVPEQLEERHLEHLCPGDVIVVGSDALFYDESRRLWLHGDFPLEPDQELFSRTTTEVMVIRFEEGFAVSLVGMFLPPREINFIDNASILDDEVIDLLHSIPVIAIGGSFQAEAEIAVLYKDRYGVFPEERLDGKHPKIKPKDKQSKKNKKKEKTKDNTPSD